MHAKLTQAWQAAQEALPRVPAAHGTHGVLHFPSFAAARFSPAACKQQRCCGQELPHDLA